MSTEKKPKSRQQMQIFYNIQRGASRHDFATISISLPIAMKNEELSP
jgi:hypothetical protein